MDKESKKVLFLVPAPTSKGGISNYFSVIKPCFNLPVEYIVRGVRYQNSFFSRVVYPFVQIWDYFYFIFKLNKGNYSFVQLNTSLGKTSLIRDLFYVFILRILRKKYLVFFRGIDYSVFSWMQNRWFRLFKGTFLKADGIIVLSKRFRNELERAGYRNKIFIETTVVDQNMLDNVDPQYLIKKQNEDGLNVLFLARIDRSKGIYEAIEAIQILQNKGYHIQLSIYGDGPEVKNIKKLLSKVPDKDIKLFGHVSQNRKVNAFMNSHLFLGPSYREGIPNSLLEAMSFGLPIITSNVGGIPDFFEDELMGYITDDITPHNLSALIEKLILNCEERKKMAEYNYLYAKNNFYSEIVVNRLEKIYSEYFYG